MSKVADGSATRPAGSSSANSTSFDAPRGSSPSWMPHMPERARGSADEVQPTVGYVVKGFPRLSELFIASEIHRLEQAGMNLALFVIKANDEEVRHPLVDRIRVQPQYLPPTESVSGIPLRRWLVRHLPRFFPALARTFRRRPFGVCRAAGAALAQALRARPTFLSAPRKVYVKEFLQAIALADRLLDAASVRHLHAHFCHGATTVTWLAAMIAGRSFSFTAHAKDLYSPSLNPAGLLSRKLAAARFAVTCTEANRQYLLRFAGPTPVYRVYHGLNAELTQLLRNALDEPHSACGHASGRKREARGGREASASDSPEPLRGANAPSNSGAGGVPAATEQGGAARERDDVLRVLAVGRLVEKKGFDVLVDACADLVRRGVDVDVRIVGEPGEHSTVVQERIGQRGLERQVHLLGPMTQAGLYDEYRRATVFCLPCRIGADGDRDGIPNVLVEAMASGVPVVTTDVSGIPEVVAHERTGLVVPPDDPAATAEALLRIHRDAALARRVAEAGRALVRTRFDGDRLIGELYSLFKRVA
jgi:glycosyltransferase involved in cell wall biosynthesis